MLGMPTIVTGNSFSPEFQSCKDSFWVDYLHSEFDSDGTLFAKSGYWADPRVSDLAEAIRPVRKYPERARVRGTKGIARSKSNFNKIDVARTM